VGIRKILLSVDGQTGMTRISVFVADQKQGSKEEQETTNGQTQSEQQQYLENNN
jgi:hypothetical protein